MWVNKNIEPEALASQKANWTADVLRYHNTGQKIPDNVINKYRCADVKSALKQETNSKCMFCESPIDHIDFPHIEHFRPKSKYPQLTFEWGNLGLACPKCNINKGDNFDENCPFINPYEESPNDFFTPLGSFVYNKPNSPRAEYTLKTIKLDRTELIERRKERLDMLQSLIERWASANEPIKSILKVQIDIEIADDKPYSMFAKAMML